MRRVSVIAILLAAALLGGCSAGQPAATNASNANGAAAGGGGNQAGTREGTGPHSTGIGGTSEANRNATVNGNSNVEPTGVNTNAGATPRANSNR
jgi:hypothetical protein